MRLNRLPMCASLIAIIVVMGVMGVLLALASGRVYRDLAIDNQRASLGEHLKVWVNELRNDFETESREIVQIGKSDPELMAAIRSKNKITTGNRLKKLHQHPFFNMGEMELRKLQALDQDFNPIASTPPESENINSNSAGCQSLRTQATRRTGAERHKPITGICIADKEVLFESIQPAGEDPRAGYLQITFNMLHNIAEPNAFMGLPLKLSVVNGAVLYKTVSWPRPEAMGDKLVVESSMNAYFPAKSQLTIGVLRDMRAFDESLAQTERVVLIAAALTTALTVLIALLALQKTAVKPLRRLTEQLRRVMQDKDYLGQQVQVGGNAEVMELAAGFNAMTTRLKELYESLESMAYTDSLTKLPNRVQFHDRLELAVTQAKHDYKPFALFIMDLDGFKDINDTLGHHVGDKLLQQVAARLRSKLRESDMVARLGGDEFAVLLPAVSDKQAIMAARMLRQSLRNPFEIEDQCLDIGVSIGIALYPDHGVDVNVLMQRADVAMYAAKHSNNGHALYDAKLDPHTPTRLALMGELRLAVEQEQFVLFYQPMVDLKTNQITGVEALVRWNHPSLELMLPDKFIPMLEQSGLIRNITPWVLNELLRESESLRTQELPITFSMNLSVRNLQDPYLVEAIAEQIEASQLQPQWLQLEITESAVMEDPDRAIEVLTRLSNMGLRLAIDDFGTGYSSLSYLKKLPVNTIKIDKSFVIGMAKDANDVAIVRTSIDLAHNLGFKVVAEGVENEETLKHLTALGCDVAQGYFISRPLSTEELGVWLKQSVWAQAQRNSKIVRLQN
jgi:diguanylate cyclase (GGDEF)-like protein